MAGMPIAKPHRRHKLLPWIACAALVYCLPAAWAADAPAGETATSPAVAATTPAAVSADTQAEGQASRVASNFAALMAGSWKDIAFFTGATVLWAVVWAVGLFFLGILVGLVAWLLLRRRALAAPWRWYRYVGWLWCVLFILSASIGFAYAGAWLGAGRNVKHAIRQDRMIDRIVCNLHAAVVLDRAEYQATGKESAEEMQRVLADSEALGELALADWEVLRDQTITARADGAVNRWMMKLAAEAAADEFGERLSGLDPRIIVGVCMQGANTQEYLKSHPDAQPVVAALSAHFDAVRQRACSLVDAVVLPQALSGAGLGIGGPVGLAGLFWLTVVLVRRRETRP